MCSGGRFNMTSSGADGVDLIASFGHPTTDSYDIRYLMILVYIHRDIYGGSPQFLSYNLRQRFDSKT